MKMSPRLPESPIGVSASPVKKSSCKSEERGQFTYVLLRLAAQGGRSSGELELSARLVELLTAERPTFLVSAGSLMPHSGFRTI
jgi:hypothetical protein